jgi:hypothetical protein
MSDAPNFEEHKQGPHISLNPSARLQANSPLQHHTRIGRHKLSSARAISSSEMEIEDASISKYLSLPWLR